MSTVPRGLNLVLTPSVEWYGTSFIAGQVTQLALSGMKKVADALNMLQEVGIRLIVDVEEVPLVKRPVPKENCVQFIVEVLLVGSMTVSNDDGKRTSPELYDLRIPLDVDKPLESGLETGEQLLDLLVLRNFTYVSTRTHLGPGRLFPETVFDVFTPYPVGFLEAIKEGVAADGGLYMPRTMPKLTRAELLYLQNFPGKGRKSINRHHRTALFITERMLGLPRELTVDVEEIRAMVLEKIESLKGFAMEKFEQAKAAGGMALSIGSNMAANAPIDRIPGGMMTNEDRATLLALQQRAANGDKEARAAADNLLASKDAILQLAKERFQEELVKIKDKLPLRIYDLLVKVGRLFTGALPPRYSHDVPRPPVWSKCIDEAYLPENFGNNAGTITPIHEYMTFRDKMAYTNTLGIGGNFTGKELPDVMKVLRVSTMFNGPTCSHKDLGMQIFPSFFNLAYESEPKDKQHFVLCATNGEAGVAAIDALLRNGPPSLRIMILYPTTGVTLVQLAHLRALHDGWRVNCVAVNAPYPLIQSSVRTILKDTNVKIGDKTLTSANSINYGRLLPMVIYFAQCFADLKMAEDMDTLEGFDVVIPSGNLGNLTAAYMARSMYIPIRTIVVCCNENDAIVEFTKTGIYKVKDITTTEMPSLDIALSGNLERLLYLICEMNTNEVRKYMEALESTGTLELDKKIFDKHVKDVIIAYSCSDKDMKKSIDDVYSNTCGRRLIDPHTAIAMHAFKSYFRGPYDKLPKFPIIVCSTAHWAKYPEVVLKAMKKPLGDYQDLGMETPIGWEPSTGCGCCFHPEVPGEEQPPHIVLQRYYLTLMDVCSGAGGVPYALRHLATHPPRLPAITVDGTYEAMVAEVERFAEKDWNETFPPDEYMDANAGLADFL